MNYFSAPLQVWCGTTRRQHHSRRAGTGGIWRIYFSAIGQIDEHSTELVSDVTSFRERLRAYFEEMIRRGHIRQLDSLYVSSLFWNLIFGFVMTLVIGRKRPGLVRDEYIENAVSVFIGGVAPKEGEAWR